MRELITDGERGSRAMLEKIGKLIEEVGTEAELEMMVSDAAGVAAAVAFEIRTLCQGQDAFDVIELVRQHELPVSMSDYRESEHYGLATVVEVVVLATPGLVDRRFPMMNDEASGELANPATVIEAVCVQARRIINTASVQSQIPRGESVDDGFNRLASQLRLNETVVRGKHYSSIGWTLNQRILDSARVEQLLETHVGFSHADVVAVGSAAVELYQESRRERIEVIADASSDRERVENDDNLRDRLRNAFIEVFQNPGASASFTASDVASRAAVLPERAAKVLDAFTARLGSEDVSVKMLDFVEGRNPLYGKGFIKDDGDNLLILGGGIPVDHVRRHMEDVLKASGNSRAWDAYGRIRDRVVEEYASELVGSLLGDGCVSHRGLKYLVPVSDDVEVDLTAGSESFRSGSKIVEADDLVVRGDIAVCLESKAGSITSKARGGNAQRMLTDLRKTVGEATFQAVRLEKLVLEFGGVWTDRGKWLDLSEVREVRCVVACLDDFGPLGIAADQLVRSGLIDADTIPWITSLHDLIVTQRLISSPSEFLLYLRRRTEAQAARSFVAVDELDVLMWFLNGGLYFEPDPDDLYRRYPNSPKPTKGDRRRFKRNATAHVGTLTDPLDAWMYFREGSSRVEAFKPTRRGNARIAEIVQSLDKMEMQGGIRVGADLLNLSDDGQDNLLKHLDGMFAATQRDGKYHTVALPMVTPWGYSVLFFGTQPPVMTGVVEKFRGYVVLKKYQLRADRAFGMLVSTTGSVISSVYENAWFEESPQMDALVEKAGLRPATSRPPDMAPGLGPRRGSGAGKRKRRRKH